MSELCVRFDIRATDATSGIADCPTVTYGGPNSAAASFTGKCRDLAGNWASRSFSLKYDSTASSRPDAAPGGPTGQRRRGPSSRRRRAHLIGPGPYRWLVWPGFGPRSKGDYGRRLGPALFRVARPRQH